MIVDKNNWGGIIFLVSIYINTNKGKLNIREQIRVNLFRKERIMITYDEFSINSIENILIKICLIKLKEISSHQRNIENLKKLLHIFSQVEIEHKSSYYLKQFYNNRKNFYYKRVLELVEFFLKKKGMYFVSDVGTSIESLFFPMEMVYENYISNKIKKMILFRYSNLKIKLQDREKFLFQNISVSNGELEKKNNFRIVPDIIIENSDKKEIFILDAKWKKLKNDEKTNYNISQEDIYQMIAYINGYSLNIKNHYNCKKAFLIYPSTNELKEKKYIMYSNSDFQVYIIFVDLSCDKRVENDLKALFEILINKNYFKEE